MFRSKSVVIGFSLTIAAYTQANYLLEFDPDGTETENSGVIIASFDWAPGSSLSRQVIPAINGEFTTLTHGSLASLVDAWGNPLTPPGLNSGNGAGADFEITFVMGVTESITGVTTTTAIRKSLGDDGIPGGGDDIYSYQQTILRGPPASPGNNFFEIYWDDNNDDSTRTADSLSGMGYNDGTLIAAGTVAFIDGVLNFTYNFEDDNDDGVFNGVDTIIGSCIVCPGGYSQFQPLDSFFTDDWFNQQTALATGGASISVDLDYRHPDFFLSGVNRMVFELDISTSNTMPFQQTNPSQAFWDSSSNSMVGPPDVGTVNGLDGPDMIYQSDSSSSFNVSGC